MADATKHEEPHLAALMHTPGRRFVAALSWIFIGSMLTCCALVAFLRGTGRMSDADFRAIITSPRAAGLPHEGEEASDGADADQEQPSYEDRRQLRELRVLNLELREQSLDRRAALVREREASLAADRKRFELAKQAFDDDLSTTREGNVAAGRDNVRLIWENVRPAQAKDQMLRMIAAEGLDEAVAIFLSLPVDTRAEIADEFKSPEELARLDEILRAIRQGAAANKPVNKARDELQAR